MTPALPREITKKKLVLVEGRDEENVLGSYYDSVNVQDVQVMEYSGKSRFKEVFPVIAKQPGFADITSLAVLRDADTSAAGAFQSVSTVLKDSGLSAPTQPGTFTAAGQPRVGILILPGNGQNGALEDLVLAAHAGNPYLRCVTDFDNCCQAGGRPPFDSKERAHGLLLGLEIPQARLGLAFKHGQLTFASPAYADLINFLSIV